MSDFYYTGSERNKSCCSWNKSELGRLEMVFMLMVCLPVNQSVHSFSPEQEAVLTVTDQNVCSYDIQREQLGDPWFFTYLDSQVKLVYLTLPQRCTANYILKLLLLTSPPAPPPCQNVYLYTANQSESNLSRSWLRVLPFLVWTLSWGHYVSVKVLISSAWSGNLWIGVIRSGQKKATAACKKSRKEKL